METETSVSPAPVAVGRKTIKQKGRDKKITQNVDQVLQGDSDETVSMVGLEQEVDETVAEEMRLKAIAILEAEIREEREKLVKEAQKEKEKEASQKKIGLLVKKLKKKKTTKKEKAPKSSQPKAGRRTQIDAISDMKGIAPLSAEGLAEQTTENSSAPVEKEKQATSEPKPAPVPATVSMPGISTPTPTAVPGKVPGPPPRPTKEKPKMSAEVPSTPIKTEEPVKQGPTETQRAAGVGITYTQLSNEEKKTRRTSMNIGMDAYSKATQMKTTTKKKKTKLGKRSGNADARLQMNAANQEQPDLSIFGGPSEKEADPSPSLGSSNPTLPARPTRKTNRVGKKKITGNKDARLMDKTLNRKKEATIADLGIEEVVDEAELARQKAAALAGVGKETKDLTKEELAARRASKNIGMDAYRTTKVIGGPSGGILGKKKKKKKRKNADQLLLKQSNNRDSVPPTQQPKQPSESVDEQPPPLPPRKSDVREIEAVVDEI